MKISKKIINNYLIALVVSFGVFLLFYLLMKKQGLTSPRWGLVDLILSIGIVGASIRQVPLRGRSQLVFMGTQTGIWLDEGYYFLFYLFTLDKHEVQHKEGQTLIIPAFDLRCADKLLSVSFNLKYLEGKSNVLNPTADDERIAKENFKNQKSEDIREELLDLMKSLAMSKYGPKDYTELQQQSISDLILTNPHFQNECLDYGIKIKSLLPFVIPKNATQEDLDLRKANLIKEYKNAGFTKEEAREMAEIQLGQIKVVKTPGSGGNAGGGVYGHYNV